MIINKRKTCPPSLLGKEGGASHAGKDEILGLDTGVLGGGGFFKKEQVGWKSEKSFGGKESG